MTEPGKGRAARQVTAGLAGPLPAAGKPVPDQPAPGPPVRDRAASAAVAWQASPRPRKLATVAVISVILAVLTRHVDLLLLGAPALAAVAAFGHGKRPPVPGGSVTVSPLRCFEGEDVEVIATLTAPTGEASFHIELGPAVTLTEGRVDTVVIGAEAARARWVVRPAAWGRHQLCTVRVRCRTEGAGQVDLTLRPPLAEVFPHPPPARATLLPPELLRRIGDHTAGAPGAGIEFFGIRGYQPGDRLRDVNWAVTSRLGQPYVNQRAALRAADLVVMVDAFSDVGPLGDTTLDVAVRGAAGLATVYLGTGDRVGVVVLGGMLKWLAPAPGSRQLFRIVEMAFGMRFFSEVTPDLDRVPRVALPPRALVVLFSPLLDRRAISAVTDLRQRGVSLIVVDVLKHEPPADPRLPMSGLAVRLWRLDRDALRASIAMLGVPVLTWDSATGLAGAQVRLRGQRVGAARP